MFVVFLSSCDSRKPITHNNFITTKDTVINEIDLVFVPKGGFKKGLNCEQDTIQYDYWIGKYEITNKQFYNFIISALHDEVLLIENEALYYNFEGDEIVDSNKFRVKIFDDRIYLEDGKIILDSTFSQHPVISVTWYGVYAFCKYYGFQIPNEREWEKAARGDSCTWFPWGNEINNSYANYYSSQNPYTPSTTPVGFYNGEKHKQFQTSNAVSAYGCYDMSGNAGEWIFDYWPEQTPFHKGKGGGFHYHTAAYLQVYYVSIFGPGKSPALDMCDLSDGFRVLLKTN